MVNCYCIRRPAVFFPPFFCFSSGGSFVASREMEMGSYLCTWAVVFRRRPNLLNQGGTFPTGTQSFLSSFPFLTQYHHVFKVRVNFPCVSGRFVKRRMSASLIFHSIVRSHYLRALTAEELEILERPLRRSNGFMRGDHNARLTKEGIKTYG